MERTSYRPIAWLFASLILGASVCVQRCGAADAWSRAAASMSTETADDAYDGDSQLLRARIGARAWSAAHW